MHLLHSRIVRSRQNGVAGLLLMLVLIIGVGGWLVSGLSGARIEIERDKHNAVVLAQAKEALIGYAANNPGVFRPGELPCPDINNDGDSNLSDYSGGNCVNLLGRLPWRTLRLPELLDASGESLWYALSDNFHAGVSTAINSETNGQLTVTGTGPASNVVAIIFASGPSIGSQIRDAANKTNPVNYNAANYLEGENANGPPNYVSGLVSGTFNDKLLTLLPDELFAVVEKRVVKEVERALNDYYNFDPMQKVFPPPARFNDNTCLTPPPITTGCQSNPSVDQGRIPANPTPRSWTPGAGIANLDETDWFQANGWRELIYYAPAYTCTQPGYPNCGCCSTFPCSFFNPRCAGGGYVTLNVPPGTPLANQKVVVIAAGEPLGSQPRASDKTNLTYYLEDSENLDLDNTYIKLLVDSGFNDRPLNIP